MAEQLARIGSWVEHLVKARTRHGVHSPFVYRLFDEVLRNTAADPAFAAIEELRDELLDSDQVAQVNDLGAGSRVMGRAVRRVSDIARTSVKPARQAQLLFRLARHFAPQHVLELGTSFGLSTLYLARGAQSAEITTIEGCAQTQRIALHHFDLLAQSNIRSVLGSFRSALPDVLRGLPSLDMAFIDGHHAEEPTVEYFEQCLAKAHTGSVFILDDIHWSSGMERAWTRIKSHPRVTVTIDLYDLGLVFFRQDQAPEHFRLRY
ncbi:MAG: class I SAM-dependent methyltransferase [Flavobacteriales bacterium]|nr:class I SAM-dependent methyltransferase [Flavobacteriales bacterium]